MALRRIISSGLPGAESAALDVAIRFRIPHGGFTPHGSLLPGDRPAGRYRLEARPFVHPALLLRANIEQSEGILILSSVQLPRHLERLESGSPAQGRPRLHIDFRTVQPEQAAFRIAAWLNDHNIERLLVTGTGLREDKGIYPKTHAAMTALLMLGTTAGGASEERPH